MNQIELHLPNSLGYEKVAMESAAATARLAGFSEDRIEDLKTAVGEACINAIEHGSKNRATERLLLTLTVEEDRLLVDVHDKGERYSISGGRPDIGARIAGKMPSRGWGTFLMKSLVDALEVTSTDEGNTTRMVIFLHRT